MEQSITLGHSALGWQRPIVLLHIFVVLIVVILKNLKQKLVDLYFVKNRNYYIDVITVQKVLPYKDS